MIRVWPEKAMTRLQDCFNDTNWDLFKQESPHNNYTYLNNYASFVQIPNGQCFYLKFFPFCNSLTPTAAGKDGLRPGQLVASF